jgi:hypothetical protein
MVVPRCSVAWRVADVGKKGKKSLNDLGSNLGRKEITAN